MLKTTALLLEELKNYANAPNKDDIFELAELYGSTNVKLLAKYLGGKNE